MNSVNVRTPHDFEQAPGSADKRKRHSSIACSCCRRLKIRCHGGESKTASSNSSSKPCTHCLSLGKLCEWPEEDGRKQKRTRQMSAASSLSMNRQDSIGLDSSSTGNPTPPPVSCDQTRFADLPVTDSIAISDGHGASHPISLTASNRSESIHGETPYTTVHYFRHLGPTAIAPGHKKISLKVRQDEQSPARDSAPPTRSKSNMQPPRPVDQNGCLPIFDDVTGLPVKEILPTLLDTYFEYYSDLYCFTNRRFLDALIDQGTPPVFLLCVMSALSSRFCESELFASYFPTIDNPREDWEYSAPFLERSKAMVMSAMSLPTPDVAAGLLMMAFADFGDNNEAGMSLTMTKIPHKAHLIDYQQVYGCLQEWHCEWSKNWACIENAVAWTRTIPKQCPKWMSRDQKMERIPNRSA